MTVAAGAQRGGTERDGRAACLSLGLRLCLTVVTCDRAWAELHQVIGHHCDGDRLVAWGSAARRIAAAPNGA